MKTKIKIGFAIMAVALVTFLASCSMVDTALVGRWGIAGIQAFSFTADGDMIVGVPSVATVTYKYTASAGKGQYWLESAPSAKVDFTYTISGTTLSLTIAGVTASLEKL